MSTTATHRNTSGKQKEPVISGRNPRRNKTNTQLILYIILSVAVVVWILPLIWLMSSSFKPMGILTAIPPVIKFWPTLEHYIYVFNKFPLWTYFQNSLTIALITTFLAILIGFLAAYGIVRFRAGGTAFPLAIMTTRLIPSMALAIPLYTIFRQLGLVDTIMGMVIAHTTFALPLSIWLMIGFLQDFSLGFEEAALIDGCNRMQFIWRILIPLIRPGLAVAALFTFIFSWNEMFLALTLTTIKVKTLPIGITDFVTSYAVLWGPMTAATTLTTLPPIIFGLLMQKHLVKGLTLGGIK